MRFKIPFFVALFILIGVLAVSSYAFINQSISYDYCHQELIYQGETLKLTQKMLLDFGKANNRQRIYEMLKAKYSDHIIKEEGDILFIDDVGFKFKTNTLIDVVFMNEL